MVCLWAPYYYSTTATATVLLLLLQYYCYCYSTTATATVLLLLLQYYCSCYSATDTAAVLLLLLQYHCYCCSTIATATVLLLLLQYYCYCYITTAAATVLLLLQQYYCYCYSTTATATVLMLLLQYSPGFGMAITFDFLQIDGICFVHVHSLSMSISQYLALLPICCSISVSRSSRPAAFPGFNRLRTVASSPRLKGLVSSVGGWLLLGTIVLSCSPFGLRCSTLLPLDNSWLAIWSAVTLVTTGGETLTAPRRRMVAHAFLMFMVRLVFYTMSLQILRLSSEISSSNMSLSWIVDSENGSLLYSSS